MKTLNVRLSAERYAEINPFEAREVLRGAAKLLLDEAACLRRAHCVGRRWMIRDEADAEALRSYKEMRKHAHALRQMSANAKASDGTHD